MIVDAHAQIGQSLYGYGQSPDDLRASMQRLGIERALLCPVRPAGYHFPAENERVAAVCAVEPRRFLGLCRVDPWQGAAALAELERCLSVLGLRGLYLNPWEDHFAANDASVDPVVATAADLGAPILIEGGYPVVSHPGQLADLARRHPRATFIATHGGQINISGMLLAEALELFRTCPNVYFETSGVYREDFIEDTANALGAERLLFGSGSPVFDQGHELDRILRAHLSEQQKQQVLSGTSARLFSLA